jgi:hypothetical protein
LLQLPTTRPISTRVLIGRVVGSCSKGTLDVGSNPTVPEATNASLYLKARYSYLRTP